MQQSETLAPAPHLQSYVRAYRFFDLEGSQPYTVPAWTRAMMLFRYGDFFYAYFPDGTSLPHLGASFFAASTRPLVYVSGIGRFRFAAAEFSPLVLGSLVHESLESFTNQVINAEDLCPSQGVRLVLEAISEAADNAARARVLDQYFTVLFSGFESAAASGIRAALSALHSSRALPSARELSLAARVPDRTLRRRFRQFTGFGPKQYARLLRFERALSLLYGRPDLSSQDVTHRLGFYDQTHFIAEARALTLATPLELRASLEDGVGPLRSFFLSGGTYAPR